MSQAKDIKLRGSTSGVRNPTIKVMDRHNGGEKTQKYCTTKNTFCLVQKKLCMGVKGGLYTRKQALLALLEENWLCARGRGHSSHGLTCPRFTQDGTNCVFMPPPPWVKQE